MIRAMEAMKAFLSPPSTTEQEIRVSQLPALLLKLTDNSEMIVARMSLWSAADDPHLPYRQYVLRFETIETY